jgi:MraZ protein
MIPLIGEFECKVDSKGRFLLPAGLKKQLSGEDLERFVVNRGFEQSLTLYPRSEWKKISSEVNSLNTFVKKNREFTRYFFRGATEVTPDVTSRLLLPKSLMEHAGIKNEIILFAYGQKIEIWAKDVYQSIMETEPDDFSSLAEEVMGKISQTEDDK